MTGHERLLATFCASVVLPRPRWPKSTTLWPRCKKSSVISDSTLSVGALGPRPVEVGERLDAAELGATQAAPKAMHGALAELAARDVPEQLERGPPRIGGLRQHVVELGRERT